MADIVASTELVSQLDAEEAMDRLRPVVKMMRQTISRNGGTVINVLGDGVVALFGAPSTHEGHALLACRAAIEIRDNLMNAKSDICVRQGIHTGIVVFELSESASYTDQEAHGAAIHLASRLQNAAPSNGIWISEACYLLVADYCKALSQGQHLFRGFSNPIKVMELREIDFPLKRHKFTANRLTPFRGRENELSKLLECLSLAHSGTGSLILIDGPAGVGKSRLCAEFAEICRAKQIYVQEIQSQLYGQAAPLQPIVDLFRRLLNINPNDTAEINREKVYQELKRAEASETINHSVVCNLLGISSSGSNEPSLGAHARRNLIVYALEKLLGRHSTEPLLLVFEDVHWIDEGSKAFVEALTRLTSTSKLICVLTHRSGYSPPIAEAKLCVKCHLEDMQPETILALVHDLMYNVPESEKLSSDIAERSGGNPYFAEELVNSVCDHSNKIALGSSDQAKQISEINNLPPTLQAVIGERIDRLPARQKIILQVASVFGKEIPLSILRQTALLSNEVIDRHLEELYHSGLLHNHFGSDGETISFRHPLVQEVAYKQQLKTDRNRIHHKIAETMDNFYRERLDEFSALIAYHYESAGLSHLAIRYLIRAARWVGSMYPRQAIRHWHDARRLLKGQPRSAANDSVLVQANAQIAWLGWREGMVGGSTNSYIQEAIGLAQENSQALIIPLLSFVEARIAAANGGSADLYATRVRSALHSIRDNTVPAYAATLYTSLIQAYSWGGLIDKALQASRDALEHLPLVQSFENDFLGYSVGHWAASLRARALVKAGKLDDAKRELDRLVSINEREVDPTVRFISHLAYVELAALTGNPSLATLHTDKVTEITARDPTPYLQAYTRLCRGLEHKTGCNLRQAIDNFSACYDVICSTNAAREIEADILSYLAEMYASTDDINKATEFASRAVEISVSRSSRVALCRATIVLAICNLHSSDKEALKSARSHFAAAASLIEDTGARSMIGFLTTVSRSTSGSLTSSTT